MKQIYVLGCSFSAGIELKDEEFIPDYWSYKTDPSFKQLPFDYEAFQKHNDLINKHYNFDIKKYVEDCKALSWPALLEEMNPGVKVLNDSQPGCGISYYQLMYNNYSIYMNENLSQFNIIENFKEKLIGSDLLIWQLTTEPRFSFPWQIDDDKRSIVIGVDVDHLIGCIDGEPGKCIPKWKKKILKDYYSYIIDIEEYLKNLMNFLEFILYQRIAAKKPSIVFGMYNTNIEMINYQRIKNPYVFYDKMHPEIGLVPSIISNRSLDMMDSSCKFNHPSRRIHKIIAKYFNAFIDRNNLL